jgi:uncharacterized membrane protein YeaQ/YmgE (transglycosylase-associated protein family)
MSSFQHIFQIPSPRPQSYFVVVELVGTTFVLELLLLALLVIVEDVTDEDVVGLTEEVEDSTELDEVLTVTEVLEDEVTLTVDEDEDAVVGLTVLVVFETAGIESGMVGMLIEIVAGIVGSVIGREVDRLLLDEFLAELELLEVDDVTLVVVVCAAAGNQLV